MVLDGIDRRFYLGSVAAALSGLAGCESLTGSDGTTVPSGSDQTTREGTTQSAVSEDATASQATQHFNDQGELTAPVDNESIRTATVSQNVATGTELIAFDDDGTATVVDGRSREVVYSGNDIGVIVNQIQDDFPNGVHLHLMDLFEYATNIVISTPMKLTGERAASNFSRRGANAAAIDPVGLRFTGSGIAVRLYNDGEIGVRGVHVEDLFVHAESGTVAVQIYGEDEVGYSPWADSVFRNIVVEGGSRAGFEMRGTIFLCTFDDIRAYGSGGHGIWIRSSEAGPDEHPGGNVFTFMRGKFCAGDGVRIDAHSSGVFGRLYANFCGGRGVALGPNGAGDIYHYVFGEVNEGPDVEINDGLGDRIDFIRGKGGEPTPDSIDYQGPAVKMDQLYGATFGRVLAESGDFVVEAMDNGSTIEHVVLRNGAEFDVDTNRIFDSQIHTIENIDGEAPTFNERTLTDDNETGHVRFDFDTRFNEPPTLSFGRRGGGIENVTFARTSADGQYYAADIYLAESGGTVDVRAQLRGQL